MLRVSEEDLRKTTGVVRDSLIDTRYAGPTPMSFVAFFDWQPVKVLMNQCNVL